MKRILFAVICAAIVPLLFWLGGFNFDKRSFDLSMCVGWSLLLGWWVWAVNK